ncbi:MAG: tRNA pseudouridine(38-40) synthase TruA [Lachnospiraceae bacterium]|nr:tRNA pseudouridine(38-40) synthase TruA [Lachnospiraceae bacterium]
MKRIKLTVSYDGTNYHGWQIQNNGITIESELNRALTDLFGTEIIVTGASRTDAGVHAIGNVAVFDVETRMPAEKIAYALNARLPEDIIVQTSEEVSDDFHPRHCDCEKTYEYRILNRKMPLPNVRLNSHFICYDLNIELMKEAASCFIGYHDFKSFCAAGSQVQDTHRTIYSLEVNKYDDMITIRVRGNGFLYNMVRIIAGTLIEVGKGRIKPEDIENIISGADRKLAGPTAPAKGLTLVEIRYKK